MKIPQRVSLHDQVVGILRQGIANALWGRELPSERALCGELQISRGTLRKALAQLLRERLLSRSGSRRRHLIRRPAASRATSRGTVIRVLIPYTYTTMGGANAAIIETMSERIGTAGYRVEIENRAELFARYRPAELARLDSLPDTAGWVVFFGTEKMQRWFAANGKPCLIIGRTSEGVQLPNICTDTQAVVRHAVGLFYRRGHRNLVYLLAEFTSLSDRFGSELFVEEARQLGIHARVVTHPTASHDLCRVLDQLIAARPRPTGFYSTCPEHCLTTLCHLLNAGLRVPADAAIIAAWDDLCLHYAVPTIAHYRIDGARMGRKAAVMLLDLLKHDQRKPREIRVLPEFVPGGTLGEGEGRAGERGLAKINPSRRGEQAGRG